MQKGGGRNKLALGSTGYPSRETQTRTPEAAFSPCRPRGLGCPGVTLAAARPALGALPAVKSPRAVLRQHHWSAMAMDTAVTPTGLRRGEFQAPAQKRERREGRVGALKPLPSLLWPWPVASGRGQWSMYVKGHQDERDPQAELMEKNSKVPFKKQQRQVQNGMESVLALVLKKE